MDTLISSKNLSLSSDLQNDIDVFFNYFYNDYFKSYFNKEKPSLNKRLLS